MNDVLRTRSQAGNAMVWTIVFAILFLASGFIAYALAADVTRANDAEKAALAEVESEKAKRLDDIQKRKDLSTAVGFTDEAAGELNSSLEALGTFIDSAKAKLGPSLGGPDTPVTLAQAGQALLDNINALEGKLAQAEADVKSANERAQTALSSADGFEDQYKAQIADLTRQLEDEAAAASAQAKDDQDRIDDLLAKNSSEEDRRRIAEDERDSNAAAAAKAAATDRAMIAAINRKVEQVEPEAVDGAVLEVSGKGGLAFLDIGGRDGLKRGTRFEVLRREIDGELTPRGWLTVETVESDYSTASLEGQVDLFDPMLPGDLVRNPHFDRGANKRYFLLGEFPLTTSREFIAERLGDLGAGVDETISVATDVLVVGNKNLSDEFAPELTETEEYAFAERIGMRIMRLADLQPFLRY